MSANNKNIIIVKKVKKGHAGHHGGMWKVAYADFVTAMMAFFLLMWLIGATPKENLDGIAKYFTPTNARRQDKGLGFDGGADPNIQEGVYSPNSAASSLVYGSPINGPHMVQAELNRQIVDSEKRSFVNIMNSIQRKLSTEIADHVVFDISPEGIRIQIMDSDNRPMFKSGTDEMQPYMIKILSILGESLKNQPNHISISGHTATSKNPIVTSDVDYWKLSALRANKVRGFLSDTLKPDQVIRIIGKADKEPFDHRDPYGTKNIRIAITLLTNKQVDKGQQVAPDSVLQGR
jgi:chemotaxis protein MotB